MPATRPTDHHLTRVDHTARIEGFILTFFNSVADIELVTVPVAVDQFITDKSFTAIISFRGIEHGFVALNCSEALIHKLATGMLGEEGEMSSANLSAVLGETINILTDNLLETSTGKQCHKSSMPVVVRSDTNLLRKLLADKRGYTGLFTHGTSQVLFKIVIHPADCAVVTSQRALQQAMAVHQVHQLFSCPRFGDPCALAQSGNAPCGISGSCHAAPPTTDYGSAVGG